MMDRRDAPRAGDVWRYPYLWARQQDAGETEGRKSRPCALAFLIREVNGQTLVLLLAITSKEPHRGRIAIEIPEIEKRRANLDISHPLWIILDERNDDTLPASCYFEPDACIGAFSATFLKRVQKMKIETIKSRKFRKVARKD